MRLPVPQRKPDVRSERYQHRSQENQMIEARKERVRELIRSLKSVQVRRQALGEEDGAFEGWTSSLTKTGAAKNRKMQRIRRARPATTSKAPSIT